jgi:hypothetical protein
MGNVPTLRISVAGIDALNVVELKKVVDRSFPLKRTTDPTTKPVPLTVSAKPTPPALTVAGEILVIDGETVKTTALDTPPPGAGFETVICMRPALAISAAVICAVNCVELTNVVVRLLPLKRTTAVGRNLVPFTVNVKAIPPAVKLGGDKLLTIGTGLLTVRLTVPDCPPLGEGLNTLIGNVPFTAMSAAVICAVNCVLLMNVVMRSLPLNLTTELPTKFEPVTVKVKAPSPAPTVDGLRLVSVGTGLLTVNVREVDVPPLGAGLNTVIG